VIRYQGTDYDDFDVENAGIEELRQIKSKLGLTVRQFIAGINELDVDCMTAMRWILLRRGNPRLVLDAAEKYDYWEFANAYLARRAEQIKEAEQQAADPTLAGSPPAGTTIASTGSTTPTSANSPANTFSPSHGSAESPNGTPGVSPSQVSSGT